MIFQTAGGGSGGRGGGCMCDGSVGEVVGKGVSLRVNVWSGRSVQLERTYRFIEGDSIE
jgi:hypothetical protein